MRARERMRPEVAQLERPAHGGEGWKLRGKEDFSANLNPFGPPPWLAGALADAAASLDHYPDDSSIALRDSLANRYRVTPSNVIVGSGSSELIRLFAEVFMERGDRVLIPRPTFMEYAFACRFMGAQVAPYELSPGEGFRPNIDAMISILDDNFKAAYLCSPNNPTGVAMPRGEVLRLAKGCDELGILLFLDETLMELMPEEASLSCAGEVERYPNLFVIRSFTKSYAVPGLRVGYGLGSRELISSLDKGRQTWNLGSLEQAVSLRLLQDRARVEEAAKVLAKERDRLHSHLTSLGARTHRPDAFYFFLDVSPTGLSGKQFRDRMIEHGVMVRDCSSFGRPYEGYVRFCVKTPEKDDLLLEALDRVWKGGK
ncbi:MAG TPA: histidinol-phosphate transaminase [Methanomassiliicoccales archaeon]|nr:histidinol-phosphate transaminase [Methanomassiliicoccales archaeon]